VNEICGSSLANFNNAEYQAIETWTTVTAVFETELRLNEPILAMKAIGGS
jgi:hypothetical protein